MATPIDVLQTGRDNREALFKELQSFPSLKEFLSSEDSRMIFQSTLVPDPDDLFDFTFDIDGLTIELNYITAIRKGLHFLQLPLTEENLIVQPQYSFVKKHLRLREFSTAGLRVLTHCCGIKLGYIDGGYHLCLTALPQDWLKPHSKLDCAKTYKEIVTTAVNEVSQNFRDQLLLLGNDDLKRATFRKQSLANTCHFQVLQQDLSFVLRILDRAIEHANRTDDYIVLVPFVSRFGQKELQTVKLDFVDFESVAALSVHHGCTITARDPALNLLWARHGLQKLVGPSFNAFSVLGIYEAMNVQTRTDRRLLDIRTPVLKVFQGQDVNFVQFYVDAPHCHLGRGCSHPISGCVTLCDLQHPKTKAAMEKSSNNYLQSLQDILLKLNGHTGLRLEYVSHMDGSSDFPSELQPDEATYWDIKALDSLFQDFPIVLPFMDTDNEKFMEVIHGSLDFFTTTLTEIYLSNHGKGGFEAAWRSFQCEMACEELLYDHCLSAFDTHISHKS